MRKLNYERDHFRRGIAIALRQRISQCLTALARRTVSGNWTGRPGYLLAIAAAPLLTAMLLQSQQQAPQELLFRDQAGQLRLRIGMSEDTTGERVPAVAFYDSDGDTEVMTLAVSSDGPEVRLVCTEGEIRLAGSDAPQVALLDQQGRPRFEVSTGPNGSMVSLSDRRGLPRVCLADGQRDIAGMVIGDSSGGARAGVFVGTDGPTVLLRDAQQNSRVFLSVDNTGGRITTLDSQGNPRDFHQAGTNVSPALTAERTQ
ncbi:MAG: hypothetical protein NXI04_07990 [Planctomycetaceae bacterium]|nr:hypothetical protein [Planctomycetaceae bacterium]